MPKKGFLPETKVISATPTKTLNIFLVWALAVKYEVNATSINNLNIPLNVLDSLPSTAKYAEIREFLDKNPEYLL